MPKNLTDVDTFTAPIVVPVGTDPRTAASVELAAQGLANRTRNLLDQGSLQRAYEASEALADVPHIDVGAGDLVVGGTVSPSTLSVSDGVVGVALGVIQFTGGNGRIDGGTWNLVTSAAAATGTNAAIGDVQASSRGNWARLGNVVTFGLVIALDSTGFTASDYTFDFNLPVASNLGGNDLQGTAQLVDGFGVPNANVLAFGNTTTDRLRVYFTHVGSDTVATVYVTGTYAVI